MSRAAALDALDRVIAALTYDEIERIPFGLPDDDIERGRVPPGHLKGAEIPLLDRSIADDLVRIEKMLTANRPTLLGAIGESINEALLAAEEARRALIAEGAQ